MTGTQAGAVISFWAFAHLLPARPAPPGGLGRTAAIDGLTALLRWAAEAMRPSDGGQPLVLVIDDAHLLDHASVALVHHLALSKSARLVVAVRAGAPAPDAVVALWKDDLLPRLELAPLPETAVAAALTAVLGGHVEALTVRRLYGITKGNMLWLRELVVAGLASGALARSDGVFSWRGGLAVAGRVRELIEDAIGDINDDDREALDYVAFGEPIDADILAGLVHVGAVERLEARRLVTADRDGSRLSVRLAQPLYGEVVRAMCGPLRTQRIKGASPTKWR